jgi:hypothetical protein
MKYSQEAPEENHINKTMLKPDVILLRIVTPF